MGMLLESQGRLTEAEPYLREALEVRRRVLGDEHPDTLGSINEMGMLLWWQGRKAEAEPYLREALEGRRRVLGEENPSTLRSIIVMGLLLNAQMRYAESEQLVRESLPTIVRILGESGWRTAEARSVLGEALAGLRRFQEAETQLLDAHASLDQSLPPGRRSETLSPATQRLVGLYDAWGKPHKAAEWRVKLPTVQDAVASDRPADEKQEE